MKQKFHSSSLFMFPDVLLQRVNLTAGPGDSGTFLVYLGTVIKQYVQCMDWYENFVGGLRFLSPFFLCQLQSFCQPFYPYEQHWVFLQCSSHVHVAGWPFYVGEENVTMDTVKK